MRTLISSILLLLSANLAVATDMDTTNITAIVTLEFAVESDATAARELAETGAGFVCWLRSSISNTNAFTVELRSKRYESRGRELFIIFGTRDDMAPGWHPVFGDPTRPRYPYDMRSKTIREQIEYASIKNESDPIITETFSSGSLVIQVENETPIEIPVSRFHSIKPVKIK